MSDDCPVPCCSTGKKRGMLMCRDHWFAVPLVLRKAVGRTWRAYLKACGPDEVLPAIKAYREAREAAIANVARGQAPVVD